MELKVKIKTWLKGIHIIFVCAWIGTVLSVGLIHLIMARPDAETNLYSVTSSMELIDKYIIAPSAIGCLLSGLAFSAFTSWGFIKFYWVALKWVTTIIQILIGTLYMTPWLKIMVSLSKEKSFDPLNSQYLQVYNLNTYVGIGQFLLLIAIVFISVVKPWGKRTTKHLFKDDQNPSQ